jgi:chemotaxis protein methyltransferase CheR
LRELLVITDKEFKQIRELVYNYFGINLTEQKRALVVGRLNKVLREQGFDSFQKYYDYVVNDDSGKSLSMLVDRISTNHTFFNRENDHFDHLSQIVLPQLIQSRKAANTKKIRIWVAGCSSGEESYMIAMLLKEQLGTEIKQWDTAILATDISISALEKAVAGVYTTENVSHMPPTLKNKYFTKLPGNEFKVVDELKKMITHRKMNLMREVFPFKGMFDIILCRNVMIYFDRPTRNTLVSKFHRFLIPGGYLYIGHSETLGRNNELFAYVKPAVYRKEN